MPTPNILLIVLDSIRAQNTSLHGYPRRTTPFLDELADSATVCTRARAPGEYSLTSHVSMFTGYHVAEHGVTSRDWKLEPGHSIWERLRDDGYATGMFSQNGYLIDPSFGLTEGFQEQFSGAPSDRDLPFPEATDHRATDAGSPLASVRHSLRGEKPVQSILNGVATVLPHEYLPNGIEARRDRQSGAFTDYFLRWQETQDGPWAACINFMDGHAPYVPEPRFDKWGDEKARHHRDTRDRWGYYIGEELWADLHRLEHLYDGTILQMDHHIRRLISILEERGELDETLIVVTGDHGQGFGEPSQVRRGLRTNAHSICIHESIMHVPLLVKYPGQSDSQVVSELATLANFPDAVEAARDGAWTGTEFVAETPLLTTAVNLGDNEIKKQILRDQGIEDIAMFCDFAHAVYEQEGGRTTKYVRWGDDEATIDVSDPRNPFKIDSTDHGRVEPVLDSFEDVGCRQNIADDIGDDTVERLHQLGYL